MSEEQKEKNKGGRPKSKATLEAQLMREMIVKKVKNNFEKYITAWEDVALGHYKTAKMNTGEVRVYKKSPDPRALKDLFEQAIGKPKTSMTLDFGKEEVDEALTILGNAISETAKSFQDKQQPIGDEPNTGGNFPIDNHKSLPSDTSHTPDPVREKPNNSVGGFS